MENNNELVNETINETTNETNKTNKVLDIAKVVVGIVLIGIGVYVFVTSNPTLNTLITQRLTHKSNTVNNEVNNTNEIVNDTTPTPNKTTTENNEITANNNETAAHTHSFTITTKTLTDAEGNSIAERYYSCGCGLELKMNE